jgi:uncharacterized membrane protein HdeD (DUF308 family)
LASAWWLVFLVGLASVVAGAIFVAKPSHSLSALAVVFGVFVLLDGVVELIRSIAGADENRALAAIIGVLGVIIGVVLIRHPTHAVTLIGLIIGIWFVVAGLVRLVAAILVPGHRLLRILVSLVAVFVGIAIVANPHIGYATLAVLTGIFLIIGGLGTMGLAWLARTATPHATPASHRTGDPV